MQSKSKRKLRNLMEFNADLDFTESVEKILHNLPLKSDSAHKYYCQVNGKRSSTLQGDHSCVVGHNLDAKLDVNCDLNDVNERFQKFNFHCGLPTMITPIINRKNESDPVLQLLTNKRNWKLKYINLCTLAAPVVDSYSKLNDNVALVPIQMVNIATHLENDPDQMFDASYNWYYGGKGCMRKALFDGHDYVVYSRSSVLSVTELEMDASGNHIHFAKTINYDCEGKNKILEIALKEASNLIAVRTSQRILLLKFTTENELGIVLIKTLETEEKILSIEFDSNQNFLYSTIFDTQLEIYDLTKETKLEISIDNTAGSQIGNKWSAILDHDNTIIYTNSDCVKLFDKRNHCECLNINHFNVCEPCNNISCIEISKKWENNLYVATKHYMLMADIRFVNKDKTNCIYRWTHGMQSAPTYASITKFELEKEILCLNSQWIEDTTLIINDPSNLAMMPYRPPNILNTFNNARLNKHCIDPILPLKDRLIKSITGCVVLDNGEGFDVFILNSLGDISKQSMVSLNIAEPEDISGMLMKEWSKPLYKRSKPMKVNEIIDVYNLWKFSKRVPSDLEIYQVKNSHRSKYRMEDIFDIFENFDMGEGLLDCWKIKDRDNVDNTVLDDTLLPNLFPNADG